MDINRANIDSLFRMITTAWQQGLQWQPPIDLSFLFSDFTSTTAANDYAWLDFSPKFREWLGDRVFQNLRSQKFTLKNRDFEKSDRMPSKDIEDDQYGVYMPRFTMYGAAWQQLKYDVVIEVLTTNPTCYTGKAFFAADHPYGDNTVANLTANALSKTNFEAALLATAAWKFANGALIRPRWTHLLHGPKLQSTAFGIVEARQISDGSGNLVDNPNYGRCKRVEVPDLVDAYDDYWFLVDGSAPVKAIARQIRKVPTPLADTDPANVERTGNLDVMASGRGAAGPAFPHMIYAGIL